MSGTAEYPLTFGYDPQGRRTFMTTSTGTTGWAYHPQRGWLTAKTHADSTPSSLPARL